MYQSHTDIAELIMWQKHCFWLAFFKLFYYTFVPELKGSNWHFSIFIYISNIISIIASGIFYWFLSFIFVKSSICNEMTWLFKVELIKTSLIILRGHFVCMPQLRKSDWEKKKKYYWKSLVESYIYMDSTCRTALGLGAFPLADYVWRHRGCYFVHALQEGSAGWGGGSDSCEA